MPIGLISPKASVEFTVAPEVVYLPIVPVEVCATKICAQVVPGMAQSATDATKPERIDRVFKIPPFRNRREKSFQRLTRSCVLRRNGLAPSN
jgi:hypothetical protein